MVHDIIYEDTKSWDETAMRGNLCHEDAVKLLQIPLLDSIKKDSLFWWVDARGMFVVKLAYELAINNLINSSIAYIQLVIGL